MCEFGDTCMLSYLKDLLVDMLGVMASYSITVKELKFLFSMLRGEGGLWVSDSRDQMQCVRQKCVTWVAPREPSHWSVWVLFCNWQTTEWANELTDSVLTLCSQSSLRESLDCLVTSLLSLPPVQPKHAVKMLSVLNQMPQRHGPDAFFNFPGRSAAVSIHMFPSFNLKFK